MLKRFIAVSVCVIIIITTLTASGCSLKQDTIEPAVTERVTNVYKTEYLTLPEKYTPNRSVFKVGDRIYAVCNETLSMGEFSSETQTVLYSVDMNGENPESVIIETQLEGGYISTSTVTSDGSFVFVENSYDMETMAQIYRMTGIDRDGNVLFSIDPSEMISPPENDGSGMVFYSSFYINSIASDSSGNIFALTGFGIFVLDSDGNKLFDIIPDTNINGMSVSGDKAMISYYDSSYNTVFADLDMEAKKIGKEISVPAGASQYNKSILLGEGYDYYIKDTTGIYGFNEGDESLTLLMNWINSDIIGSNIYEMTIIDADTFIYLDNVRVAGEEYRPPQVAVLKRIPDDEVLAKYLIRLVVLDSYLPNNLTSNIVKFNRNSLTHRVYIDDYSRYNDGSQDIYDIQSQAVKTLAVEIAAGEIPDMVLGDTSFIMSDSLEEKGVFADLYELMDNDPDINRDDFLKCIRLPFETDGKLYKLITEFSVNSIIGKTENIGHLKESWSLDTMIEYSKSLPEGTELFSNSTSDDMLLTFTIIGIDDFVDWETKECKFDQETFINVLEYAKTFPQSIDYSSYSTADAYENQRNDKVLLESFYLSSFSDYLRIRHAFGTDDLTILGYPGALGGAIITPQDSYSISVKSAPEVQEGAWQFLKQLVTDTSRLDSEYGYGYSWSSTYEALDKIAEGQKKMGYKYFDDGRYQEVRYYLDADGNDQEMFMMGSYGADGEDAETQRLTDEDIEFVKDFLDNVTSKINYDMQIISIIQEESMDFFAGTKTAEETAKIIQSRISIYVSESK